MGTKTVVKVPVIREENVIKKVLNSSNWSMISIVMFLTLIGIVMIYSATFSTSGSVYVTKQLFAFLLGLFFNVFVQLNKLSIVSAISLVYIFHLCFFAYSDIIGW
jgi:cell division protein FtsW (lipid II flippase)